MDCEDAGFEVNHMTLRELTENLDVNTPLYIGPADSEKVVFIRKHASDVIPEPLLEAEIVTIVSCRQEAMYIFVRSAFKRRSLGDLLSHIAVNERVDVWIIHHDGTKEQVYSDWTVGLLDKKYDGYMVKEVSTYKSKKWGYPVISIVIEPCEEGLRGEL